MGNKVSRTLQKYESLWTEKELQDKFEENEEEICLPKDIKEEVLESINVLLVVVNKKESLATRCYLKPLDGHTHVYQYSQCAKHENRTEYAVYQIGKYGACPTAIRTVPCFSDVNGGGSIVPMMAYSCFPNLGAIIGVGVACGVKRKVQMCDVLVSQNIINYDKEKGPGAEISASSFLTELFQQTVRWPDITIKNRLKENGMKRPAIVPGKILSGPYLISDAKNKKELVKKFASEVIGIEMEGAYLFAAVQDTNAHTIIVKAVCDFGDGSAQEKFHPTAALLAADCVSKILDNPQLPELLDRKTVFSSMEKAVTSLPDLELPNYSNLIPEGKKREDKPVLQDLLRIAPQYAARWREIGIELQLKDYDLDNIDLDNAYHPYRTVQCFRCVLEQWLKEISSPNWGKLDDAIKEIWRRPYFTTHCSYQKAGYWTSGQQKRLEATQEAFDKYYKKLVDSLPMTNEMFMADLTPLCSDDLKANLAALLTRSAQAKCFLENEIKAPLDDDDDYLPFTTLLSIMEKYDDVELQMLAKEIQEFVRVNSSCYMPLYDIPLLEVHYEPIQLQLQITPEVEEISTSNLQLGQYPSASSSDDEQS